MTEDAHAESPLRVKGPPQHKLSEMFSLNTSEPDLLDLSNQSSNAVSRWCRTVDWKEVRSNTRAYLNLLALLAIIYLTFFCIIGEMTLPALYLILIWQAAHVGGFVFDLIRFPSIVGMMLVGFILRNLMGPILDPLPDSWIFAARQACAVVVVLRAGMEVEVNKLRELGFSTLRLIFLPGLCEVFVIAILAQSIFGMPIALCFTMGFIMAAAGPAIILSGMTDLTGKGYGVGTGVAALLVAASTFDDMVSVCGLSISVGLAFAGGGTGSALLHGLLNLVVGLSGGVVSGVLCWMTTFWNTAFKRNTFILCAAQAAMFGMWRAELYGAGPLWIVIMGMTAAYGWRYGTLRTEWLATPGPHPDFVHSTDSMLAVVWEFGAKPLLFGIIGATIHIKNIEPSYVSNSLVLIAAGLPVRVLVAFLSLFSTDLVMSERVFCASAWISKALFQAVFGSLPLQVADTPEMVQYGQIILTASVLEIVIMAPLAALVFHKLGPVLLRKRTVPKKDTSVMAADSDAVMDLLSRPVRFEDAIFERAQEIRQLAVQDSRRILHKFD